MGTNWLADMVVRDFGYLTAENKRLTEEVARVRHSTIELLTTARDDELSHSITENERLKEELEKAIVEFSQAHSLANSHFRDSQRRVKELAKYSRHLVECYSYRGWLRECDCGLLSLLPTGV